MALTSLIANLVPLGAPRRLTIHRSTVSGPRFRRKTLPEIRQQEGDHSDSLEVYLSFRVIFDLGEGI
jgi:hypothetical protein